jgi:hypothetical protein
MTQQPVTGVSLIARERARQVVVEGWSAEHDAQHMNGELSIAAACYAVEGTSAAVFGGPGKELEDDAWPWEDWDKRSKHNRLKRLAIAGALIAAEIDRELREQNEQPMTPNP